MKLKYVGMHNSLDCKGKVYPINPVNPLIQGLYNDLKVSDVFELCEKYFVNSNGDLLKTDLNDIINGIKENVSYNVTVFDDPDIKQPFITLKLNTDNEIKVTYVYDIIEE